MNYFLNNVDKNNQFIKTTRKNYFVDKTELIAKLNNLIGVSDQFVCITRPRRFGKSINASMLASYYSKNLDTKDVFDKLNVGKCESYEKHLNKHNVIYLSFNTESNSFNSYEEYKDFFVSGLIRDVKNYCPDVEDTSKLSILLKDAYQKLGQGFIFIIDEWDYIFNKNSFCNDKDKENFLALLENLLKDKPYVELAYMTGILPIAKYFSTSFCNMFDEYSMVTDDKYGNYFGFTQSEVEALCAKQNVVTLEELEEWYNGYYTVSGNKVYNPRSVYFALDRGICRSYWTNTGKMDEIIECVQNNVDAVKDDILKMIEGKSVGILLSDFATEKMDFVTREQILSAMVVLGLLSYHDDHLTIPNRELRIKFADSLKNKAFNKVADIVQKSNEMLFATLSKDAKTMERLFREAHSKYTSILKYNNENSISCVVTLIYLTALKKYDIIREEPAGEGYADFVFKPYKRSDPAFIIELKVDDTPDNAIQQIKNTNYMQTLDGYTGTKLAVGITYNKKDKKHFVKVEELE